MFWQLLRDLEQKNSQKQKKMLISVPFKSIFFPNGSLFLKQYWEFIGLAMHSKEFVRKDMVLATDQIHFGQFIFTKRDVLEVWKILLSPVLKPSEIF